MHVKLCLQVLQTSTWPKEKDVKVFETVTFEEKKYPLLGAGYETLGGALLYQTQEVCLQLVYQTRFC